MTSEEFNRKIIVFHITIDILCIFGYNVSCDTKRGDFMELPNLMAENIKKQNLLLKTIENTKLHGYGNSDIHVIAEIDRMDHANVTKISHSMCMTKGAISKVTKRLVASECITPYTEQHSHKEVYFELTEKGEFLRSEHKKRYQKWLARDIEFMNDYSDKELRIVSGFIKDYNDYLDKLIQES